MNNEKILAIKNIHAAYYKKEILKGVSLTVEKGEILAVIGPNGSGKSTLLKVICGMLKPLSGTVEFKSKNVTGFSAMEMVREGMGYLIQGGEVFTGMSVYENLSISGMGLKKNILFSRIQNVFGIFPSLEKLKNRRAGFLSGGEKQALALSMVLMKEPDLLLLDEPSAGLSPVMVRQILDVIKEINSKKKTTIVLVEQNIKEALHICRRVYLLKNGTIAGEEKPQNLIKGEKINELFFT